MGGIGVDVFWVGLCGGSGVVGAWWFVVSVGQVLALVFLMGVTGALFGFVVALRGGSRGCGAGGVWVGLVGLGLILVSVVGWLVGGRG